MIVSSKQKRDSAIHINIHVYILLNVSLYLKTAA